LTAKSGNDVTINDLVFHHRHAGVYTAEEVALIMRDKLIRLQSLYIDQFKRLQHVMKEKRRKYLQTTKQEREALGKDSVALTQHTKQQIYTKLARVGSNPAGYFFFFFFTFFNQFLFFFDKIKKKLSY
jgi:hypothetical protein